MGLDETWKPWDTDGSKSPRGIRGHELLGGAFEYWKVQGKLGGYLGYPDKLRGIFNEGGLFGERLGWHLPPNEVRGMSSRQQTNTVWEKRSPSAGLPSTARYTHAVDATSASAWEIVDGGHSGVGFFRTSFDLHVPSGHDVMMSFEYLDLEDEYQQAGDDSQGQPYRALLFVNGWMMGKRVGNLGPQTKFPVHEGILNYHGTNTVVLVLWAMDPVASIRPDLHLVVDKVYEGNAFSPSPQSLRTDAKDKGAVPY